MSAYLRTSETVAIQHTAAHQDWRWTSWCWTLWWPAAAAKCYR